MITVKGTKKELEKFFNSFNIGINLQPGMSCIYNGMTIRADPSLEIRDGSELGLPKEVADFIESPSPMFCSCKTLEEKIERLDQKMKEQELKEKGWTCTEYGEYIYPPNDWK